MGTRGRKSFSSKPPHLSALMYYFYILKSEKDGKLYKGYTSDLRQRVEAHLNGMNVSTRYRQPLRLIYYEAYASKVDAMKREQNMKLNAKSWGQLKRRIAESLHEG